MRQNLRMATIRGALGREYGTGISWNFRNFNEIRNSLEYGFAQFEFSSLIVIQSADFSFIGSRYSFELCAPTSGGPKA